MAWDPAIAPGERVLVACHVEARRRVPFHVVLSDRRVIWGRSTMWAVDGMVTESNPIDQIDEVRLTRPNPVGLWLFGAFSLLGFATAIFGVFTSGTASVGWFMGVAMLAGAAIAFTGARKRLALRWRISHKRRRLVTPVGSHAGVRDQMAEALREIHRLLQDRNALGLLAAREVECEARPHAPIDESDRELCPDGSCTGLLGPDGKCKVCGLLAAS